MDRQKLRGLVFEKTGIKVDCDDPIFALVALNEAVLADTVERQVALLNAAAQELARQARAGGAAAPLPPETAFDPAPPFAPSTPAPSTLATPPFAPREWRLLGAAGAVAALSALLVLAGQALLAKPQLTPQQSAAIAQGDKLARAVQKLDPKNRALIEAEMQKP